MPWASKASSLRPLRMLILFWSPWIRASHTGCCLLLICVSVTCTLSIQWRLGSSASSATVRSWKDSLTICAHSLKRWHKAAALTRISTWLTLLFRKYRSRLTRMTAAFAFASTWRLFVIAKVSACKTQATSVMTSTRKTSFHAAHAS